jgi:hypothetical protein
MSDNQIAGMIAVAGTFSPVVIILIYAHIKPLIDERKRRRDNKSR